MNYSVLLAEEEAKLTVQHQITDDLHRDLTLERQSTDHLHTELQNLRNIMVRKNADTSQMQLGLRGSSGSGSGSGSGGVYFGLGQGDDNNDLLLQVLKKGQMYEGEALQLAHAFRHHGCNITHCVEAYEFTLVKAENAGSIISQAGCNCTGGLRRLCAGCRAAIQSIDGVKVRCPWCRGVCIVLPRSI